MNIEKLVNSLDSDEFAKFKVAIVNREFAKYRIPIEDFIERISDSASVRLINALNQIIDPSVHAKPPVYLDELFPEIRKYRHIGTNTAREFHEMQEFYIAWQKSQALLEMTLEKLSPE